MLGLAFWAIQGGLIVMMVVMTVRGEQKYQQRQRDRLHVERPGATPVVPGLALELVGFTPRQRARLVALRDSVRAAQNGNGALTDDVRSF
jgi:hypothetical protein